MCVCVCLRPPAAGPLPWVPEHRWMVIAGWGLLAFDSLLVLVGGYLSPAALTCHLHMSHVPVTCTGHLYLSPDTWYLTLVIRAREFL